jgi:hypothetical protein
MHFLPLRVCKVSGRKFQNHLRLPRFTPHSHLELGAPFILLVAGEACFRARLTANVRQTNNLASLPLSCPIPPHALPCPKKQKAQGASSPVAPESATIFCQTSHAESVFYFHSLLYTAQE